MISELLKSALHRGLEPGLYFWRDSAGNEIDALLNRGTDQAAIEIKSGQTVADDFFSGLEYWRVLTGDLQAPGGLVYGGDRSFTRRGFQVYSWADL